MLPSELVMNVYELLDTIFEVMNLSLVNKKSRETLHMALALRVEFRCRFVMTCLQYTEQIVVLQHRVYYFREGLWLLPYCNCYMCWHKKSKFFATHPGRHVSRSVMVDSMCPRFNAFVDAKLARHLYIGLK